MSQILVALKNLRHPSHYTHLGVEFRKDIQWWQHFLPLFPRTSVLKTLQWESAECLMATDACLQGAAGIFLCIHRVFHFTFPEELKEAVTGINQLEAISIIIALKVWSGHLKGRRFIIDCDNFTTVLVINSGRVHEPFLHACAREIAFLASVYQVEVKALHRHGLPPNGISVDN